MNVPRVTVITATWQRHGLLLGRCIPSVQAQGHPDVEHLVVSDGPDEELGKRLAAPWLDGWRGLWYRELPAHSLDPARGKGVAARLAGLEYASGEYIGYCDDDDSLRPDHCHRLAAALDENPGAGFAVSQMASHHPHGIITIGYGPLAGGNLGTPMILHRRSVLEHGSWAGANGFEDWDLCLRWINAGVQYVRVEDPTCDAWPSSWRGSGP